MGLIFHRSWRLGRAGRLHASRSGLSYSHRLGPFTWNTRGRLTLRLGRGFSWRIRS
jgi:hypothetical protein